MMELHFEDDYYFDQKKQNPFLGKRERLQQAILQVPDTLKKEAKDITPPSIFRSAIIPEKQKQIVIVVDNKGDHDPWFRFFSRTLKLAIARLIFTGNLRLIKYTDKLKQVGGILVTEEQGFTIDTAESKLDKPSYLDYAILDIIKDEHRVKLSRQVKDILDMVMGTDDVSRPARAFLKIMFSRESEKSGRFHFYVEKSGFLNWRRVLKADMEDEERSLFEKELARMEDLYNKLVNANPELDQFFRDLDRASVKAIRSKTEVDTN